MTDLLNPFPLSAYYGPELFCDREHETKRIIANLQNGIHTSLISARRMGKTGLIHHVFHKIRSRRKIYCIYLDIYATQSLRDFTNQLGSAVLRAFPEKQSIGKQFMQLLKGLRPVISFDALSNEPQVSFEFSKTLQYEHSLESIFAFLERQRVPIAVAIDEFQQITTYPEKNMEALLRTLIQPLKNVRFVFSGSSRHILTEMFNSTKRPFFSSTQPLFLHPVEFSKYEAFIKQQFLNYRRKMDADALVFILQWSRLHTYYTQAICNRVFTNCGKHITLKDVQHECAGILKEQEHIFYQYRQLLTPIQWNLLRAIAIEDKVYKPSSKQFIYRHNVGTAANIQRALEALMQKEMIYNEQDEQGSYYRVYDCFLARWLEKLPV